MNRRGFMGLLAGVAAAATLDPEKLLWVPGAKSIFIPAPAITVKCVHHAWVQVLGSWSHAFDLPTVDLPTEIKQVEFIQRPALGDMIFSHDGGNSWGEVHPTEHRSAVPVGIVVKLL